MTPPLIVSWGGGVNSTAMLIGMFHRQIRPDLILFADTGGEKPETYAYRDEFQTWLDKALFPPVVTVRNDGMYGTLEKNCLEQKTLPSIAFGFKACSDKYKRRPQNKYAKTWQPALDCWAAGHKVRKAIGYDAGERHRGHIPEDDKYTYWYPMIEWEWHREECVEAIRAEGLSVPPKSACFYCPSSTKREIRQLAKSHPELLERALAMEAKAMPGLKTVAGLARRWAWVDLVLAERLLPNDGELRREREASLRQARERTDLRPLPLFPDPPELERTCMCFDGDED